MMVTARRVNTGSRAGKAIIKKKKVEPQVGIIFLVGDQLFIDGTPLSEAGVYSDHLIHEIGHDAFWETLGIEDEYDAVPRARVAYSTRHDRFELLADACILAKPEIVAEILRRLHLPEVDAVKTDMDAHYRCAHCLRHR